MNQETPSLSLRSLPLSFLLTAAIAVGAAVFGWYRTFIVLSTQLEHGQSRITVLEVARERTADQVNTLTNRMNVAEVRQVAIETQQTRIEASVQQAGGEIKTMIRELHQAIEQLQEDGNRRPK